MRRRLGYAIAALAMMASILGVVPTPLSIPSASAASTIAQPFEGGTVTVYFMGGFPTSRIATLLAIADDSLCSRSGSSGCNGLIQPGDAVVIGDNYMAWLDRTRTLHDNGNGGGGALRGLWQLVNDSSGNKNFRYVFGTSNWAPNNLYPCQDPLSGCGGDALELLASPGTPGGGELPEKTYRMSDSGSANIVSANYVNDFYGPRWELQIQGTMTQKDGRVDGGTTNNGSRVDYNVFYKFWNNDHLQGSEVDRFFIDIRATMDVCGSCGVATQNLDSTVMSLGLSANQNATSAAASSLVLDNFSPRSHSMGNQVGTPYCPSSPPSTYPTGTWHPTGSGFHMRQTTGPFKMYASSNGAIETGMRYRIAGGNMSAYGSTKNIAGISQHQFFKDPSATNPPIVYDQKVGGGGLCGQLGTLNPGQTIAYELRLAFEYLADY